MAGIFTDIGRLLSVLVIFILFSCAGVTSMTISEENQSKIVTDILNHTDFLPYLHPEAEGRVPVRIVTNGLVSSALNISIFGRPVDIYEQDAISPYIEIDRFELSESEIQFRLTYEIEGIVVVGNARLIGGTYKIENVEVSES